MCSAAVVSIVVNCRNSEKYLAEALDSIYLQSFFDWEIILIDNASTDSTAKIAHTYGKKLKYFYIESPVTLGAARNLALSKCNGTYIAFLDSDDIWMSEKLEEQLTYFQDPGVGLVFSNVLNFTDDGQSVLAYSPESISSKFYFGDLLAKYDLTLSSVVVRKDHLKSVGMYFDDILEVAEEAELFLRLAYRYDIKCNPKVLTHYRVHKNSDSWNKASFFLKEARYIVKKFNLMYPEFHEKYRAQSLQYLQSSEFGYAVFLWRSGQGKLAREHFKKLQPKSIKIRAAVILSYFPFDNFSIFIKKLSNRIYPEK